MRVLSGQSDLFGLDLGATGIRIVELKKVGNNTALSRYGQTAFQGTFGMSDSKIDRTKVASAVSNLINQMGISSKNAAVNLPSNKVFTTVIDMDKMPEAELAKTIRYQADSYIPTPLAESKIDWAVLGNSPKDAKKTEILLSSAPNNYIEDRLALLESIGLNITAFEPDCLALVRSLVGSENNQPQLVLDIGSVASDLVITVGQVPHLSRSVPIGLQGLVVSAAQRLGIDRTQAEQFVFKFGLSRDKLEGQIYSAIVGPVDNLVAEIDKSIKFYLDRYPGVKMEKIIVTGGASVLPEFPLYIANKFGVNVEIGNPWRNISFNSSQQNELLSVANHFAIACGLAERS